MYCTMDNAGPDRAILKISNFTAAKSHEVCTVLLDKRLFLKNWMTLPEKRTIWPLSRFKTINLDYHTSLSVVQLVRFWFKSYCPRQTVPTRKPFPSGCVHVHTRCLSICAPSFVAIVWCKWALWVIAFWAWNTPQTYPVTLSNQFCCLLYSYTICLYSPNLTLTHSDPH